MTVLVALICAAGAAAIVWVVSLLIGISCFDMTDPSGILFAAGASILALGLTFGYFMGVL